MKKIEIFGIEQMRQVGRKLSSHFKNDDNWTILLNGDLAHGKTTFTQGIGAGMGIKKTINSPSFTIMKQYYSNDFEKYLYHFDFYRMTGSGLDLDFLEYIDSDNVVVIEWPKMAKDLWPEEYLEITFTYVNENDRILDLKAFGKKYEEVLEKLWEH